MATRTKSPTKKYQEFVSAPIGNKPVTDVPGVGPEIGRSLRSVGIDSAQKLYTCYCRNPKEFKRFMESHGANEKQSSEAYTALEVRDDLVHKALRSRGNSSDHEFDEGLK